MSMRLGERLVKDAILDKEQINQALELQKIAGGQLGDILLAMTSMRALDYYKVLAKHYHIAFINLLIDPVDDSLLMETEKQMYIDREIVPVKKDGDICTVATANPCPETISFIQKNWGETTNIVCTTKYDILFSLQKRFSKDYLYDAINSLVGSNAHLSSKYTFSKWQLLFLFLFTGLSAYIATINPIYFFMGLNIFLMVSVAGVLFYKIILTLIAYIIQTDKEKPYSSVVPNFALPVYSILIPLYEEKIVTLRHLFISMEKIDYPKHRLDIKILVEQDDIETINILKKMKLPRYYEFIYIPMGFPRTKAKACNYGLRFARGEYVTLYDAEDKPDPLQLRIALNAFYQHKNEQLACVQSRLNFYNANENWLTKMFCIEYTYWFDLLLPALEYLRTPIPLGGTSNHFKTSILREIYAWDPYNVTEDADLGTRLARLGYTTRVIASTTYEEANCQLINWIRQRTRWIKGYIQTYIVHMRNPFKLWKALGANGFFGFQLFIGGTILTNLANLILWSIFLVMYIPSPLHLNFLFPKKIMYLATINFFLGTFGIILLNILGVLHRKEYKLLFVSLTSPVYWLLMSIASYRALFQLIFNPSHWEKTEHGISKTLE